MERLDEWRRTTWRRRRLRLVTCDVLVYYFIGILAAPVEWGNQSSAIQSAIQSAIESATLPWQGGQGASAITTLPHYKAAKYPDEM